MKTTLLTLMFAVGCPALQAVAQTEKTPEPQLVYSPALQRTGGTLATVGYIPLAAEISFRNKVNEPAISLWPEIPVELPPRPTDKKKPDTPAPKNNVQETKAPAEIPSKVFTLEMADGKYAGWMGILRANTAEDGKHKWTVEHKYFDGLCDAHLQIVSLYGAGDFSATVPASAAGVPLLSLVCLYGPVTKTPAGITIAPEFIRVWKQPLFTFMDYGVDHSNAKWIALRKVDSDHIYSPSPDQAYYDLRLGKNEAK